MDTLSLIKEARIYKIIFDPTVISVTSVVITLSRL